MSNRFPFLTPSDEMRAYLLQAACWHLYDLAAAGDWDRYCDTLADRLGRFGLHRN